MKVRRSVYSDHFAADHMPALDGLPDFTFDMPELVYPDTLNAAVELLDRNIALGRGDKIAIFTPEENWTYRDIFEKSNQISHVLVDDMGLETGNRVLLRSSNNPMMVACWFAVLRAGGIAVSTMPLLRERDLIPMIKKAKIAFSLCDADLMTALDGAADRTPSLKHILYFNGPLTDSDKNLETLMAQKPSDFKAVATLATDIALIAFTSGTTGVPKATLHFHQDIMSMCHCVGDKLLGIVENDVVIGSPPLAFTYGLGALVGFPFYAGASTVLLEKATSDDYLGNAARFGASWLFTAPTVYRAMLAHVAQYDLSRLKNCVSAGEHLPLVTYLAWQQATGLKMIDGIGSTEMIHIFISAKGDEIRPGATGKPIKGYMACVLDDKNNPHFTDKVGRLAVKGPTGCKYLSDDHQALYVQNGWNVTGDIYRVDEDGYYWYLGRTDDMIISSGYNISGREIEDILMEHDGVLECAVVACPHEARGQIVKAFIVLAQSYEPSEDLAQVLQEFVKATTAPYKYPRAIEFVAHLPKTKTGKLQRFVLRQKR